MPNPRRQFFLTAAHWLECRYALINPLTAHSDPLFALVGEMDAHAELTLILSEFRAGGPAQTLL